MGIIDWFIGVVYKSLFLAEDTGFRRAHFLSKAVFILSITLLITRNPGSSYLLVAFLTPLGLMFPGLEWVVAILGLSAFTGLLLAASAYLVSLLGFYQMHVLQILDIVLRTMGISMGIVFSFNIISPIELYNALYVLRGRRVAVIPLMLWKMIPQGLRNFMDSLMVGYSKREIFTKRIPPAVASLIEASWLTEEYCYWKLRIPVKTRINLERSYRHTIILLTVALFITLIQAKFMKVI
ncbi:MAG: hypothetical protein ACPLQS_02825 [Desulfurococcaceae archaeon]